MLPGVRPSRPRSLHTSSASGDGVTGATAVAPGVHTERWTNTTFDLHAKPYVRDSYTASVLNS